MPASPPATARARIYGVVAVALVFLIALEAAPRLGYRTLYLPSLVQLVGLAGDANALLYITKIVATSLGRLLIAVVAGLAVGLLLSYALRASRVIDAIGYWSIRGFVRFPFYLLAPLLAAPIGLDAAPAVVGAISVAFIVAEGTSDPHTLTDSGRSLAQTSVLTAIGAVAFVEAFSGPDRSLWTLVIPSIIRSEPEVALAGIGAFALGVAVIYLVTRLLYRWAMSFRAQAS